jgi:hypothetical protein
MELQVTFPAYRRRTEKWNRSVRLFPQGKRRMQ